MPTDEAEENNVQTSVAPQLIAGVRALRATGQMPGIFWTHFMNVDLARRLSNNRPFYSVGLTHDDISRLGSWPTCEDLAECIATKMAAMLPSGPHIVGGYSVGGILAYAVASRLRQQGSEVPLLILVEPMWSARPVTTSRVAHARAYSRYLARLGWRTSVRYAVTRVRRGIVMECGGRRRIERLLPGHEIIRRAVRRYHPPAYAGCVHLVLSSQKHPLAWPLSVLRNLLPGRLSISHIECCHNELLNQRYASSVAAAIELRMTE